MMLINRNRLLNWKYGGKIHHYRGFKWKVVKTEKSTNLIRYEVTIICNVLQLQHFISSVFRKTDNQNLVERIEKHIDSYFSPVKKWKR